MAHACNPSYLGGRYQKDHSLKPAQANGLWDPISKKPNTKQGLWSGSCGREPAYQVQAPEFKPQYHQK
jgi:hypothetical protein